ncbi:hypothetical protein, partial [Pararobbsia silviterrae]
SIDTRSGSVNNAAGTMATRGALTLHAGAVNNESGALEAKGSLTAFTNGAAFDNSASGRVIGDRIALSAGELKNNTGLISATTTSSLHTTAIENHGGAILAGQSLELVNQGALNNAAGQIGSDADVKIASTAIDNTAGAIYAGGTLSATAATIINAATRDVTVDTHTGPSSMPAGLQGTDVMLLANQSIDNRQGQILARRAISSTTPSLSNDAGKIETPGHIKLAGLDAFVNRGDINGGTAVAIHANTIDNRDTVQSKGDITVDANTSFKNSGRMIAGGDLTATAGRTRRTTSRTQIPDSPLTAERAFNDQGMPSTAHAAVSNDAQDVPAAHQAPSPEGIATASETVTTDAAATTDGAMPTDGV